MQYNRGVHRREPPRLFAASAHSNSHSRTRTNPAVVVFIAVAVALCAFSVIGMQRELPPATIVADPPRVDTHAKQERREDPPPERQEAIAKAEVPRQHPPHRICDHPPSANGSVVRWTDARTQWQSEGYSVLPGRDAALQLVVEGCKLSDVDGAYARRCLRGKHIVLMGDSLTRYQYIHLVTMLSNVDNGGWGAFSASANQSINEKSWDGWEAFYAGSNARMGGLEICDCYRPKGDHGPGGVENRYFFDPVHNIRVTFIAFLNSHAMRHHPLDEMGVTCNGPLNTPWTPSFKACPQKGCEAGKCVPPGPERPELVYGAPYEAITKWSQELAPLHALFVNSGLWGDFSKYPESVAALLKAGREVRDAGLVKHIFWKTTTTPQSPTTGYDAAAREYPLLATLEADGWERYDSLLFTAGADAAATATGQAGGAFWDLVHLNPGVYRGLNQALLAEMCWKDALL